VRGCDICQKIKALNHPKEGLMAAEIPDERNKSLSIDLIGPLPKSEDGNHYALVIVDDFTKAPEVFPLRKASAVSVVERTMDYCSRNGYPQQIRSNNGPQFASRLWEAM